MSRFVAQEQPQPSCEGLHPLVDSLGRKHRSLRISVTDVCNIRCQYCMPEEDAQFLRPQHLLSFAAIAKFVRAVAPLGVTNLRLTGGEPLLRPNLPELVRALVEIPGIDSLALTTNGMLIPERLPALVEAGVRRLNISLDTLCQEKFKRLSRRDGLAQVLAGIEAARQDPRVTLKLNALVLRDVNLDDVTELAEFALERDVTLRFIEFMPLDAERAWSQQRVVTGAEIRQRLEQRLGPLVPIASEDASRPAREYAVSSDARLTGRVGFIDTVSAPFCGACDRLRLTADGKLRNCLFGREEWALAELLNGQHSLSAVRERVRQCVQAKHPAHGIAESDFEPPDRAMYQIGG